MIKGQTVDNVTFIEKKKHWVQNMTYDELLRERLFMRGEKRRVKYTIKSARKIDPRGMWSESIQVVKILEDMVNCCDWVIELVEKEMCKRLSEGKGGEK